MSLGIAFAANAADIEVRGAYLPANMTRTGEGREARIIREVLEACGHRVTFVVEPFTRHWKTYEFGQGDAVSTVPAGLGLPGAETVDYIAFQNGVSVLKSSGRVVSSLDDLAGLDVIAFSGATVILPGLKDAIGTFGSYREVSNQIVQSRLLFAGRADAVIADGMIFAAYNEQLRRLDPASIPFDAHQDVAFFRVFAPSPFRMLFRDSAIAGDFDRCFRKLDGEGAIDRINVAFVERYRDLLGGEYLGY
ncbi:MAG: ABC transporter substrate-binding protein [Alphaproteobacteria bacterium]|nr:ABC transporter substrate-binding protein [Alphaproteobacteria bacterium]